MYVCVSLLDVERSSTVPPLLHLVSFVWFGVNGARNLSRESEGFGDSKPGNTFEGW